MAKARYFCNLCNTIVHDDELSHPCSYYKNDDAVYTIPQQEDTDEMSTNREHAEKSNDDYGNICVTAEQTRNTSQASTSIAHSASSRENKEPDNPTFTAPNRKGEMDAHAKQPLELKQDEGAVAGPSAVHPHLLGPGGKRQYVCDVCHKQFKYKSHFVIHYRTHTGEKPFVCDTCGKAFFEKGNLTRHAILHTGEKPFACDTCGKKFTRKEHIETHLRTHTGDRPFVCDICGRSSADRSNFKKHISTHNGGKRFTCSVCGETFGSNQDRNNHFRDKHQ